MSESGKVQIHGKEYRTVAYRVKEFKSKFENHSIETDIISIDDERVCTKAVVRNPEGAIVSTGLAEETRNSSAMTKTSAVEICETSSVGRALAFLGLAGTELASADEVSNAMSQQAINEATDRLIKHNQALRENFDSIVATKEAFGNWPDQEVEFHKIYETYEEITIEDQMALWVAPTKGGIWTTEERKLLKSDEYAAWKKKNTNGDKQKRLKHER